jgi:hypothetical protein
MAISAQHTKFVYPDYVSPLPAEDLIKVALRKQEQFDQNVTKVQSQLDIYGQLKNNIYNEGEKAYFDETMTKLVKAVNDSAGIDFSKTANVQAVLNIGKPLEKDGVIVNSIQNGKEIQRRQKTLSELDQSKRGPANDWFYMQDAYDYMKSTELGTSIAKGKEYNEFVDISDMVVDLVKNFSKEEQEEFYRQGGGMTEGYLEKITQQGFSKNKLAEKIRGMISTDPKAARQLELDTQYAYNNLGPQRAHQMYVEDQTLKVATLDNAIAETKEKLDYYTAQNARVKSPTLQKEIDGLNSDLTTLTQYRTVASQNAAKSFDQFNPQDYYGTYQNNFVTSLANTYSVQKISKDLKDDKVWDVIQKRNQANYEAKLDIEKEQLKAGIESKNTYDRTLKQNVVDLPETKTMLQSVVDPRGIQNLQLIKNKAIQDGNTGSAGRIQSFLNLINEARQLGGVAQLKKLKEAVSKIKDGNALNAVYKDLVLDAIGVDASPYDQEKYKNIFSNIDTQLKELISNLELKGLDSRTPVSLNNNFDFSLGSAKSDFDFMLNAGNLGNQFAIAVNPETITEKSENNMITEKSTVRKFGEQPPKPVK